MLLEALFLDILLPFSPPSFAKDGHLPFFPPAVPCFAISFFLGYSSLPVIFFFFDRTGFPHVLPNGMEYTPPQNRLGTFPPPFSFSCLRITTFFFFFPCVFFPSGGKFLPPPSVAGDSPFPLSSFNFCAKRFHSLSSLSPYFFPRPSLVHVAFGEDPSFFFFLLSYDSFWFRRTRPSLFLVAVSVRPDAQRTSPLFFSLLSVNLKGTLFLWALSSEGQPRHAFFPRFFFYFPWDGLKPSDLFSKRVRCARLNPLFNSRFLPRLFVCEINQPLFPPPLFISYC